MWRVGVEILQVVAQVGLAGKPAAPRHHSDIGRSSHWPCYVSPRWEALGVVLKDVSPSLAQIAIVINFVLHVLKPGSSDPESARQGMGAPFLGSAGGFPARS